MLDARRRMATPRPSSSWSRAAPLVAALVALGPIPWFAQVLAGVPGWIVVAAGVPAALYALAIVWIDRGEPEPPLVLAAALFAGAVFAAYAAHTANAWLLAWAARPLAASAGAPIVEEIAKAMALLVVVALARDAFGGTFDGIVYGALVGIGFAFTENVVYLTFAVLQGGSAGLLRAVYVRALLGGGNHAAFTATTGAAFGWAWTRGDARGRLIVAGLGLLFAMLQHVVWNAVAASAIQGVLCGPELAGGPCRPTPSGVSLFVTVPLLTAVFVGPGLLTLGAIAVVASRSKISR